MAYAPGAVRDSIVDFLSSLNGEATLSEISEAVASRLGSVSASSVRSYLNLNVQDLFERTGRGRYRLRSGEISTATRLALQPVVQSGKATLYHGDSFDWLASCKPNSFHAVVTDPPYGVSEYSEKELTKLRNGTGGIWRIPPSFDGNKRAPLPRFTILNGEDRKVMHSFFCRFGVLLKRVIVPGGNVIIASNPLLSHLVASAMAEAGFEIRGYIARLIMTMRGGDRPKNAHLEFSDVSVMPRSQWEPWVVLRRPLDGRVQDNLRRWKTGGFRRLSADQPFGDVIRSSPAPKAERAIAPHPSLKPQDFLRQVVRASLPLGEGIVVDPFAGSGSTLAAANSVGYQSIGIEADAHFVRLATEAIPNLTSLR
jgi:DNA modification methylase